MRTLRNDRQKVRGGLLFALALLASRVAPAQPLLRPPSFSPRLIVAAAEEPIAVASLDVRVVIHGPHAETTQTVVFSNPNNRVLEGNLEFPLPDGATVSGFALDVSGELVDASVVQKEKARVVLETEIRKGVDPGLVEQVRGNLYRARVYPIPARGTRTVRLRWVSELTTRGNEAAYDLPLPYDRPIGQVTLRVDVIRAPVKPELQGGFGNVTLTQWDDRWVAQAKWTSAAPTSDLLVRLPALPDELVALEPGDGSETFFSVSSLVPVGPARDVTAPARIALAWDSSGSRTPEATERELSFITALLTAWPQTVVDLVVFRDRPEPRRVFGAGHVRELIEALRAEPIDGGTALSALDLSSAALPDRSDTHWVLVSDGLGTIGESLPRFGGVPVYCVSGSSVADRALLRHLSRETGGEMLDLVAQNTDAAVAVLTHPRPRLLAVTASPGAAVADLMIVERADRARAAVGGRLLAEQAELTLSFGPGNETTRKVIVRRAEAAGDRIGPVSVAWAQARAETLALFADRNADELLALGRRFGLVTPGTSLLILETLEQHLTHEVEPAVSRTAMHAEYLERVAEKQKTELTEKRDHLEEVVELWRAKVQWWKQQHFDNTRDEESEDQVHQVEGDAEVQNGAVTQILRKSRIRAEALEADSMADFGGAAAPPAPASMEAKAEDVEQRSADASIAIQPWDPQVPYLASLKAAAHGQAYAAYLVERRQQSGPAFFLDCADFLLRAGEKELGLRVLSNLAELRLDDPALLRVLAWRLSQSGELDAAVSVLEKVLRLRPEEPQSKRDLALVLGDRAEAKHVPADTERAVGLLYDVVLRRWDRFPEIETIALMELNRLVARAERAGWSSKIGAGRVDPRLKQLLDTDLRVSLSWDADETDVDLHVLEPTREHAFYGHNHTRIGGVISHDLTQGYGPEEYLLHRAVPGDYGIFVHYYGSRQQTLIGPATLVATVFTNWGRPNEKREVLTLRLDEPKELESVGVVNIGGHGVVQSISRNESAGATRTLLPFRSLRRGMSVDAVTKAVGQPDRIEGAGDVVLVYALEDGMLAHVKVASAHGVSSVRLLAGGADTELLP